ncbi:DNA polymerase alpha subunit B N-terminal-domain-containing protein [Lipomyces oligophaga]|uniref:DNA polymerase alpha subunit B N-terminal-domain-containing protein n=1 Tax=Lipomyces oligophaga TaxID=45792 RepID=UPI0034CF2B5A
MPSITNNSDLPANIRAFYSGLSSPLSKTCESLQTSYAISAADLFYKIESYRMQLTTSDNQDLPPVSEEVLERLRVRLQDQLERKQQLKKQAHANLQPGMSSSLASSPVTPMKRKLATDAQGSSPFAERTDAGKVLETLNGHVNIDHQQPATEKVRMSAFMDFKKYQYRTMRQSLFEVSEYLDERIEQFADVISNYLSEMIKNDSGITDPAMIAASAGQFGRPDQTNQEDEIVVGRIVSDSIHASDRSKLNKDSILLEGSRRMASGARVKLRFALEPMNSKVMVASGLYSFFPGQIVALKGNNPGNDTFVVRGIVAIPDLPFPDTSLETLVATSTKPTRVIIGKGPFTTQEDLEFAPLEALVETTIKQNADVLILLGPFIDVFHPCMTDPSKWPVNDTYASTPEDLFRACISSRLRRLEAALPAVQIVLIPACGPREAVQKHISYPAPPIAQGEPELKKQLALPRRSRWLCNPSFFSINSVIVAVSNADVIMQLSKLECTIEIPSIPAPGAGSGQRIARDGESNVMVRQVRQIINQRSMYPVFPSDPNTTPLDVSYLGLADIKTAQPDLLIVPSDHRYFAKVIDNVVAVNPGSLTKLQSSGTFACLDIAPLKEAINAAHLDGLDQKLQLGSLHKLYDRCRVEIRRI